MPLVLVTGKGGVGKTATAAATAVHASRHGVKTLLVSADPAHSLADTLAAGVGDAPAEVAAGLFAQQIDPGARADRTREGVQRQLDAVFAELGTDPPAADELSELPTAADLLALLELRDQVLHGPWDLVVVDCPPSAETIRLLTLPDVLLRHLRRLLPMERRITRALAGTRPPLTADEPPPVDHVVAAAERLAAELTAVRDLVAAPATTVRLVTTAESVVLAETRRTWTALALHGFTVDQVIANRVFEPAPADAWRHRWSQAQERVLAEAEQAFAPVPLVRARYADSEPVGVAALAEFGAALVAPEAPDPRPDLAVERTGDGFVLALDVPLARREDLHLGRRGDDLVVTLPGHRRVVSLPSALCRCRVAGAALRDGRLAVRFEPDPALWRPM